MFGLLSIFWRSLSHIVRMSSPCVHEDSFLGSIGYNGNLQGLQMDYRANDLEGGD